VLDQRATILVLGNGTPPLLFSVFLVNILLGLGDELKAHRKTAVPTVIQRRQKVDAFDQRVFRVIVMPANDRVLVRIGFLFDAVINNQHACIGLHFAHERFHRHPQVSRRFLLACQVSGDLVVAHGTLQQLAQAGGGGRAKRRQQVLAIQIQ